MHKGITNILGDLISCPCLPLVPLSIITLDKEFHELALHLHNIFLRPPLQTSKIGK